METPYEEKKIFFLLNRGTGQKAWYILWVCRWGQSVCFYSIYPSDVSPSCTLFLASKLQGDIPPVHAIIYSSQKDELSKYSALTWLLLNEGYSALTSSSGRCLCCLLARYKCRKAKFLSLLTRVLWRISICDLWSSRFM